MHPSAIVDFLDFLQRHVKSYKPGETLQVLDVGSYDVNGTLRTPLADFMKKEQRDFHYTGMDQSEGPNVDVVGNAHAMPFASEMFDIIISSSCFEHDPQFWVTFKEMVRVAKSGALIYINAPSAGPYHGYPGDCWRFYADSWAALAEWCPKAKIVQTYVEVNGCVWKNSVGIYTVQHTSP